MMVWFEGLEVFSADGEMNVQKKSMSLGVFFRLLDEGRRIALEDR